MGRSDILFSASLQTATDRIHSSLKNKLWKKPGPVREGLCVSFVLQ